MNYLSPIFTERRECQDCYKCVRHCPVKAVKVEAGCATVMPELCVYCGQCVEVCPNGAKRVRDDLPRTRQLIASGQRVIVSLAPSYVAEWPGVRPGQIIRALRQLGFTAVSETALGAQQVSAHVREILEAPRLEQGSGTSGVLLSSACPSVVDYVRKHRPELTGLMTGLLSPLLAHCRMLRQELGEIAIVFIGPCIAKKTEADAHPQLLEVALTFEDLRRWLEVERIDLSQVQEREDDIFVPERAREGAMYPVDGGMIAGVKAGCAVSDASFMSFSGLPSIQRALEGMEQFSPDRRLFIELLACEGGCVNGPRCTRKSQTALKRFEVLRSTAAATGPRPASCPISADLHPSPPKGEQPSDAQVRDALRQVGKFSSDDELNCGGCGYDSCREFGRALLVGKAERAMCVTYMRKLAQRKANALIQKMPSAVVIVDETLKIIEHNAAFLNLVKKNGGDAPATLEGAVLKDLVPFHALFTSVLRTGEEVLDKDIRLRDAILHVSLFTIEKHCVVGAIIQDVTRPSVQKEQVIRRAQEVIAKNLATVQQIAYLLGENAAESEITLNSIIELFTPPKPEEPRDDDHDWRKLYRR